MKQVCVNCSTASCTFATTRGFEFPTVVTAIPEAKSIKEFPKMLEIRPIVVDKDNVVLGGNMRLKACKDAGLEADNYSEFTPEDWTKLNQHLKRVVCDLEEYIEHTEIHHSGTVKVDEVHIKSAKDMTVVQYTMDGVFSGFDD